MLFLQHETEKLHKTNLCFWLNLTVSTKNRIWKKIVLLIPNDMIKWRPIWCFFLFKWNWYQLLCELFNNERKTKKSHDYSNNITVNEIYQLFTYRVKNTFALLSLYVTFSLLVLKCSRTKREENRVRTEWTLTQRIRIQRFLLLLSQP